MCHSHLVYISETDLYVCCHLEEKRKMPLGLQSIHVVDMDYTRIVFLQMHGSNFVVQGFQEKNVASFEGHVPSPSVVNEKEE